MSSNSIAETLEPRKAALRDYFGPGGFERWKSIYGDGEVSFIRRTVREGHAAVVEQSLAWVEEAARGNTLRVIDAGCGPGLVAQALARRGHRVDGCDLAEEMVQAAYQRFEAEPEELRQRVTFTFSDLESFGQQLSGAPRDLALCLDVLIYYPEDELVRIFKHLKALAPARLIFTYAPASPFFRAMHWLGKKFPHRHRATRLEIIGEKAVRRALAANSWQLVRQRSFSKGFYHVVLAEAVAVA
ncbi:MAG TPA: magnesium protoporphyrin IX methyltransferase [Chloroflexia bacterium]|nr:magnesium protoporphyrin IX methyltransferase [Chloroflexia bacterium]